MDHQYLGTGGRDTVLFGEETLMAHMGQHSPVTLEDEARAWQHISSPLSAASASVAASSSNAGSALTKNVVPLQKRRRVTRACDECRRKKIKCDGKQPCTHCTVYSYECTYNQPSNRRRNPAPQYIEALESRLQRTEAFLKTILPDIDLNRLDFDASKIPPQVQSSVKMRTDEALGPGLYERDSPLESMVQAAGRLDIDEAGHMDFHGHSSGLTYLAHLNHTFGDILGDVRLQSSFPPVGSIGPHARVQKSSSSSTQSPGENLPDTSILPSREVAQRLVETCLDQACVLVKFIHKPSFMGMLNRIYDLSPDQYEDEENTFLPLLYEAFGVGCLFIHDTDNLGLDNSYAEAMRFFNAGRRMIEMTDIRDIYSLQAVLLMIILLQSSARMSTCYSYVGIALSAAVRMGLHRALPEARFSPVEREIRKRIFWTCWKMDTYVGALLGLPKGIAPEDIDQEMPAEVDDEYISNNAVLEQPEGTLSRMAGANAHTRLLTIMAKVVRYIYPLRGVEASVTGPGHGGYSVSQSRLHEIEADLVHWLDTLPMPLGPGDDAPKEFTKCQYLLKMSHAHVQMMLYRPFVHYLSRPKTSDCDDKPYAIASACVNVARKIVHIADDMRRLELLNGAYWFTIYTNFFSVITLVYYVLPLFDKIPEKMHADLVKAAGSTPKRPRGLSQSKQEQEKHPSDRTNQSSPDTVSAGGSSVSSPQQQQSRPGSKAPGGTEPRRISSPNRSGRKPSVGAQTRADSYSHPLELGQSTSLSSTTSASDSPIDYRAQMPGEVLSDMSAMMFPASNTPLSYNVVDPMQRYKGELQSPVYSSGRNNPFGSLEGNILGPLPPYLFQGQQSVIGDGVCGQSGSSQKMRAVSGAESNQGNPLEQDLMNVGNNEAMIRDFFRDEWDEAMMNQNFRP